MTHEIGSGPSEPQAGLATSQALVQSSRKRVEDSFDALRNAVRDTTGAQLERKAWALPLIAAAAGFSLALLWRRRRR